jgi:shikimate dehydrogenase
VAKPLILGLVGHPISHSLSPRLHQAALAFAGLPGEYRLFDITASELSKRLKDLVASDVSGFNVTIPHKQALFELVQSKSSEAERVGALNTVKVLANGNLHGHNTDCEGLKLALAQNHCGDFTGKSALLLGAGGAALAAATALYDLGFSKLRVLARHPVKQMAFLDFVQRRWQAAHGANQTIMLEPDRPDFWSEPTLVINATSIGLTDEPQPVWMTELIKQLPEDCLCFDMVYRKDAILPTFARLAQERQLKSLAGLDMLVHQAKLSFQYWTGVAVPFECMKSAIS